MATQFPRRRRRLRRRRRRNRNYLSESRLSERHIHAETHAVTNTTQP